MTEFAEARKVAAVLAALAEPTRLRVIWHLTKGPAHVGAIAAAVGVKMVNISHHLGVMRTAGVLEHVKEGRQVVYTLNPDVFRAGANGEELGVLVAGHIRVVLRANRQAPPSVGKAKRKPKK
jgi:DNA-binding transcriptional ArsR family regulator